MVGRPLPQVVFLLALVLLLPSTTWVQPSLPPVNQQLTATSLPEQEQGLPEEQNQSTSLPASQAAAKEKKESSPFAATPEVSGVEVSGVEERSAQPVTEKAEKQPAIKSPPPKPVAYRWGAPHRVSFRTEVKLTNSGNEAAEYLWVDLPLLENSSPYQSNTLQGTNYAIDSREGRVASFFIGDLAPGETKKVAVDYLVTIRPVSLSSSNDTVEKARQAYRQYARSGNCRALATGFVGRCRELGVTARLVNGFTRSQRALLAPGSLKGCRHSWAEFYVDGLGWVPVDLTFGYFADFPIASHLVESYDDQSVRVNYLGGKVEAIWENMILP